MAEENKDQQPGVEAPAPSEDGPGAIERPADAANGITNAQDEAMADVPVGGVAEYMRQLEEQLESERRRAAEYLDNWQRARADFLNLKKRTDQEKADLARYANADLMLNILSVVDDFERAMMSMPADLIRFTWIEGVLIIYRKMLAILEKEGLEPIEAEGKDFDPALHEAVLFDEGAEGSAEVVRVELQRGYKLRERLLRPSLVKVGKREPQQSTDENQSNK